MTNLEFQRLALILARTTDSRHLPDGLTYLDGANDAVMTLANAFSREEWTGFNREQFLRIAGWRSAESRDPNTSETLGEYTSDGERTC